MTYPAGPDIRATPPDELAPVIPWPDFIERYFDWRQDQHVGLIGPTEAGKSVLTKAILPLRKYVTIFGTKPRDRTLDEYITQEGFIRLKTWPPMIGRKPLRHEALPDEMPRRILWPDARQLYAMDKQREIFRKGIADIYAQGGWCVVWDEFWYMCTLLKLETEARVLLQQARSNYIAFVMGAQRPSRIPLELFDQASHLFFARDNDEVNLKRISGVGWLASDLIRAYVANLERYQFLYVNTREGWMARTKVDYAQAA